MSVIASNKFIEHIMNVCNMTRTHALGLSMNIGTISELVQKKSNISKNDYISYKSRLADMLTHHSKNAAFVIGYQDGYINKKEKFGDESVLHSDHIINTRDIINYLWENNISDEYDILNVFQKLLKVVYVKKDVNLSKSDTRFDNIIIKKFNRNFKNNTARDDDEILDLNVLKKEMGIK